jgi:diguanylate cyclase (GGDEF)-like protein
MLLPTLWLAPLVAVTYAHARWRGLRVPLWKWVGSGSFVTLAALAAACTAQAAEPPGATWTAGGVGGVLVVTAAAAVFLAVETALFHGTAYLNEPADEVWLRGTLRSRDFYLTEGATLLVGGLSAAMWAQQSWLVLLLVPVYGLAQRAVLHQPLVERANVDAKTGVLRFEAWRRLAVAERDRCAARRQPWSVIFADLDHFKRYNDTWGHLAGDEALAAVAALCKQQLRAGRDLAGRFGGEEFCLFLPGTGSAEAAAVAERLRVAVREMRLPSSGACVTLSLGVAGSDGTTGDVEFAEVMHQADRTLLEAKTAGRDGVRVAVVDAADERLLRSWPGVTPHP